MKEVTKEQVLEALRVVGVQPGDGLLVHSAIQFLGRPVGGVGMYFDALCASVNCNSGTRDEGSQSFIPDPQVATGTLAFPAFNFAFARGEPFDPQNTPSVGMGVLSEFVRQQPGVRRTLHPLQSLAVFGCYAMDLAARDTLSAFDPGSAFERMLELDFKLLLLGADIQAVSMLHYSEQRAKVAYRYWKEFTGPVRTETGWETRTYRMFARDLEADPRIELYPVQRRLEARGLWFSTPLSYGQISLCKLSDFARILDDFIAEDPFSLVTNREKVERKIGRR